MPPPNFIGNRVSEIEYQRRSAESKADSSLFTELLGFQKGAKKAQTGETIHEPSQEQPELLVPGNHKDVEYRLIEVAEVVEIPRYEVVEQIVEVEKIVYVDRIVEVEKIVEK